MYINPVLLTDSYKMSHWRQYPKGTQIVYSYLESRGGDFDYVLNFGGQAIIQEYLEGPIVTQAHIDEARTLAAQHFGNQDQFNLAGWQYILDVHEGKLPLKIKAAPEGMIIPTGNVLMTVENTDPNCFWLTNYLETLLLQVWYPMTVATQSHYIKTTIQHYLDETAENTEGLMFKLHDFGFRGVSSVESAGLGGAAHLVNFMGTDTFQGIMAARQYYGADMPGFSIPASEHSTITSWTEAGELDAMRNMLEAYPTGLVACVSDSYDIYRACRDYWGTELRDLILNRDGTLVIRPDSGDPKTVLLEILPILGEQFGYTVNSKGYKELPPQVRVIQGDGVNKDSIKEILEGLKQAGWSADNLAFGMGGALLQGVNRDTLKFAFKCSSITINGEDRDVYKQPVTAAWKASKKGRFKLVETETGYQTISPDEPGEDLLETVYNNGTSMRHQTFEDIRQRAQEETAKKVNA